MKSWTFKNYTTQQCNSNKPNQLNGLKKFQICNKNILINKHFKILVNLLFIENVFMNVFIINDNTLKSIKMTIFL